jgi:hypothetical protein
MVNVIDHNTPLGNEPSQHLTISFQSLQQLIEKSLSPHSIS